MLEACAWCGTRSRAGDRFCTACGRPLTASTDAAGITYALNHLDEFVAAGALDAEQAERLRRHLHDRLASLSGARPAPPPAAPPRPLQELLAPPGAAAPARVAPPAGPSPIQSLFTEQTPSLLLYLGAFLIVVSALIFVNVSGQQISDLLKLALMLAGTLGFLAAGVACHRYPRVLPAGRTFLVIGALLTAVDFAAYYALVIRQSPFTSPALWLAGSLVSGGLYAALALTGFGRGYAYLFVAAALSAAGAAARVFEVGTEWLPSIYLGLALALLVAHQELGGARAALLTRPLREQAHALAAVVVTLAFFGFAASSGYERSALTLALLLATAYAWRLEREWEPWGRVAALFGAGFTFLSVLFALRAPTDAFGVGLLALAVLYAVVGERIGRRELRLIAYAWVAGALLLVGEYERSPAIGALVMLGLAALIAWLSAVRETPLLGVRADLDRPHLYAAALLLHAGERYLLMATPLPGGGHVITDGASYPQLALAFFPLSLALGASALLLRSRAASLATTALASAAFVALASGSDATRHAVVTFTYAAVVGATAVALREPRGLWLAAAFAALGAFGAFRWAATPAELRPVAFSLIAGALFGAGLRLPDRFGPTLRQIALAAATLGLATGYVLIVELSGRIGANVVQQPIWRATAVALLVLGVLAVLEARARRRPEAAVVASGLIVGVALMEIARFRPSELQAYTIPVGVYLLAAAFALRRLGPTFDDLRASIEVAGGAVLMGPALARAFDPDGLPHGVLLFAEGLAVLALGLFLRRAALRRTALAFLALGALPGLSAPRDELPFAIAAGALVLALAALAPRLFPDRDLDAAELVGATLFVGVTLRHGFQPAAFALVTVAFAQAVALVAWSVARRREALLVAGLVAVGIGMLRALDDPAALEVSASATGIALLAIAAAAPRARAPAREWHLVALEVVGAVVLWAIPAVRAWDAREGARELALLVVESLAVLGAAVALGRGTVARVALGAVGYVGFRALFDPVTFVPHAALAGLFVVALPIAAVRFAPRAALVGFLVPLETVGAVVLLAPPFVRSLDARGFGYGVGVVAGALVVLGVGVAFRRRWPVGVAVAFLGAEALRATADVVNRLPNWAVLAISGALLLAVGFVLLLKRESWLAWQRRVGVWWRDLESAEAKTPR